ncbi:MAG: hypothetical protein ACI841_001504 [Planctomycetota bacterium]|jgi:hypothetical protein
MATRMRARTARADQTGTGSSREAQAGESHAHIGMTLVELMLVMALVSVILGMGLGMFASLNPGERIAVGMVQNVVRSAGNTALARGAPARVEIDRNSSTITAKAMKIIGTWRFENTSYDGAFDIDGTTIGGGRLVDDGFQGKAISFDGEPLGSKWEATVQNDPAWDFEDGFAVDLCLRREEARAMLILSIGQVIVVRATQHGALEVYFVTKRVSKSGVTSSGGRIWLKSEAGVLRLSRWDRVRVVYDRHLYRMIVNDVEVAALAADMPVFDIDMPLIIGGGSQLPLPASIDNLVVATMDGEDTFRLPESVRFAPESAREVQFAAGGGLEPTHHEAPVQILLEFGDGRQESVTIGLYGTVE